MGNDICIGRKRDKEEDKLNVCELFIGSTTSRKIKTPRKYARTQRSTRNIHQRNRQTDRGNSAGVKVDG